MTGPQYSLPLTGATSLMTSFGILSVTTAMWQVEFLLSYSMHDRTGSLDPPALHIWEFSLLKWIYMTQYQWLFTDLAINQHVYCVNAKQSPPD